MLLDYLTRISLSLDNLGFGDFFPGSKVLNHFAGVFPIASNEKKESVQANFL